MEVEPKELKKKRKRFVLMSLQFVTVAIESFSSHTNLEKWLLQLLIATVTLCVIRERRYIYSIFVLFFVSDARFFEFNQRIKLLCATSSRQ